MTNHQILKNSLLAAVAAVALVACGDDSTELASPGTVADNPGTGSPSPEPTPTPDPEPEVKVGRGGIEYTSEGNCPTGTSTVEVGDQTHCSLSGTITNDVTLTAGNIYQLDGKVVIGVDVGADGSSSTGDPAVLTIEAGAVLYGATASDVLVISRGSEIQANGSQANPVVFTSALDLDLADELGLSAPAAHSGSLLTEPYTAEWGGIVINGRATINTCNGSNLPCEAEGEGDSGLYGGDLDTDTSGSMTYVQVKYAGNPITADDELNGIAFQGVGSGTELDYIQVHNGADDGVEFFGGTAEIKHLVITGADDDSLDWTQGWRGKGQHIIIKQNPAQAASDQGIEADNLGDNRDFLPRAQPMLANMTIVGSNSQDGETDIGILLREGTGANIYNTVVSDFGDAALDIDHDETFTNAGSSATNLTGNLTIQSTLLSTDNNTVYKDDDNTFDLETYFTNQANNAVGATTLSNAFINGSAEAAVTATDVSAVDSFFDATDYVGAVASDSASDNWTTGWTYGLNPDPECPEGTTADSEGTTCTLSGTYTSDLTLVAGLDYVLDGKVVIGVDAGADADNPLSSADPAVLTIEPGVTVMGADLQSLLVVSRGSKLNANGTEDAPVTFTAIDPDTRDLDVDTSLWGGIVINGRATINTCNGSNLPCEAEGEGDSGLYGGDDDADSSGQLFYTRVVYAGNPLTSDDELNGIAFQGVGTGTTIDYLQVHNGADDGVEFFGGTVNAKHLVITGADDDSLDWTQGWRGNVQHLVIVQNPNQAATDQGIEADNLGDNRDFLPRAHPTISNATIIGAGAAGGESDIGILLREGTAANLYNVVVADFGDAALDIDHEETFAVAGSSATDLTGDLTLQSTLLSNTNNTIYKDDDNTFDLETYFTNQANNIVAADTLTAPSGAAATKRIINGATEAAATATDVSAINSWFDATSYIGAIENAAGDWVTSWTVWLNQ